LPEVSVKPHISLTCDAGLSNQTFERIPGLPISSIFRKKEGEGKGEERKKEKEKEKEKEEEKEKEKEKAKRGEGGKVIEMEKEPE